MFVAMCYLSMFCLIFDQSIRKFAFSLSSSATWISETTEPLLLPTSSTFQQPSSNVPSEVAISMGIADQTCAEMPLSERITHHIPNYQVIISILYDDDPLGALELLFVTVDGKQIYPLSYSGGNKLEECFDGIKSRSGTGICYDEACTVTSIASPWVINMGNQRFNELTLWGSETYKTFTKHGLRYKIVIHDTNNPCSGYHFSYEFGLGWWRGIVFEPLNI